VGLWSSSFLGLLMTQFLVALNDNMFRWLVIPIGKDLVAPDVALSAGAICFLLPFVLLAGPAGYLADRFSKRTVMIWCKVAEIVIVGLGMVAILLGSFPMMLIVLALLASQSALFSPSKLSSIPELVRSDRISAANGLMGMTTMIAIIIGTLAGGFLYDWTTLSSAEAASGQTLGPGQHHWWLSAGALVGVAIVGWVASLFIGRVRPADPSRRFPWNPAAQSVRDLAALFAHRPLFLAALASAFFWALGALSQVNVDKFARPELVVEQQYVGPLLGVLTLGIGVGSLLAGIWSAGRVEVGLVPLGAFGISAASMLMATVPQGVGVPISLPYFWAAFWLFGLGVAAGLYDIPLQAFLQDRSPPETRGSLLAAYNLLAFAGMLLASVVFWFLASVLHLSARQIFFIGGIVTVPVGLTIVWLQLLPTVRVIVRLLVRVFYRLRVSGLENIPQEGGALLVSNHVSWLDGALLTLVSPRPIRMIAYSDYVNRWWLRRLTRQSGVIPIATSRKSVVQAIRAAREALREGQLVCIFPEGTLTRTGQIHEFQSGFLSIVKDTGAPIVPVYLGGLWGSVFSFERGRYFWKWPRRWHRPISIRIGQPIDHPATAPQVRLAVQELEVSEMPNDQDRKLTLPRRFLRMCRRNLRHAKLADSTGTELTGAGMLTRTLILRRLLRRYVLADGENHVGLLLPPSVPAALANAALTIDKRVAINLNYTVSSEVMNLCIEQAGIRHVLTSRRVLERFPLDIHADVVFLEDYKEKVTLADKLIAAAQTWLLPAAAMERWLGLNRVGPDDLLTIIFTSGSTGRPKGVMLSQDNVGSNVTAFDQVLHLGWDDVVVGILPFFHSFGYTTTLWSVLSLDSKAAYHYTPLEPRQVGKLCREHGGTLLVATPTFLRSYLRRCEPEDLASLNTVIAGAEKLSRELADAFENKFGVRPSEGYGTTELSPVVSTNVPACRIAGPIKQGTCEGSVGQPLPGLAAKVVDLETGEDLESNKSGMLLITGPNVMQGYLGLPDQTAQVLRDGWYVTGDIAFLDENGFIHITGRQSRFSKIGGEMIPHLRIEEALVEVLHLEEEEEIRLVVTGVPDPRKGERVVVLHTGLDVPSDEICRRLAAAGLPPLWIPSPDSFCQIDAIPVLGTGKLDLKQVKDLALERFAVEV
jgi:acyl-[acyl-carrier-protein]-phospholipid O-acyltransferase/long-chain-fatty-acid--[acyl-carrier-protein] ligase